ARAPPARRGPALRAPTRGGDPRGPGFRARTAGGVCEASPSERRGAGTPREPEMKPRAMDTGVEPGARGERNPGRPLTTETRTQARKRAGSGNGRAEPAEAEVHPMEWRGAGCRLLRRLHAWSCGRGAQSLDLGVWPGGVEVAVGTYPQSPRGTGEPPKGLEMDSGKRLFKAFLGKMPESQSSQENGQPSAPPSPAVAWGQPGAPSSTVGSAPLPANPTPGTTERRDPSQGELCPQSRDGVLLTRKAGSRQEDLSTRVWPKCFWRLCFETAPGVHPLCLRLVHPRHGRLFPGVSPHLGLVRHRLSGTSPAGTAWPYQSLGPYPFQPESHESRPHLQWSLQGPSAPHGGDTCSQKGSDLRLRPRSEKTYPDKGLQ
ncbi:hypothetical protein EI555_012783, partial [Monodon monoceros]